MVDPMFAFLDDPEYSWESRGLGAGDMELAELTVFFGRPLPARSGDGALPKDRPHPAST